MAKSPPFLVWLPVPTVTLIKGQWPTVLGHCWGHIPGGLWGAHPCMDRHHTTAASPKSWAVQEHPSVRSTAATAQHSTALSPLTPCAALGPSLSAGWETPPKGSRALWTHTYLELMFHCSEHWKSTVSMHCFLEIMTDNDLCLISKFPLITWQYRLNPNKCVSCRFNWLYDLLDLSQTQFFLVAVEISKNQQHLCLEYKRNLFLFEEFSTN